MYSLNTQCLLGIQCKDFMILAADQNLSVNSLLTMSNDDAKIQQISKQVFLGAVGSNSDCKFVTEYLSKNIALYEKRHSYELSIPAVASMARNYLAQHLRSDSSYSVNLIIGGINEDGDPEMHTIEHLGSSVRVPFTAVGLGGMICLSILDRYYKSDLNEEEAEKIIKLCIKEINERVMISLKDFQIVIVRNTDLVI